MGDPCVGDQRNIGERHRIANQPVGIGQLQLHHTERAAPLGHQLRIDLVIRRIEIMFLEAPHSNGGLVRVLFPEQPAHHLGPAEHVRRDQVTACLFGEIQHDGVGLWQRTAIRPARQRHLTRRVQRQEVFGLGAALKDIDLYPIIWDAKQVSGPFRFHAIAGNGIAVKCESLNLAMGHYAPSP